MNFFEWYLVSGVLVASMYLYYMDESLQEELTSNLAGQFGLVVITIWIIIGWPIVILIQLMLFLRKKFRG